MSVPQRDEVDARGTPEEVRAMGLSPAALSDEAIALIGFQRTKTVSKRARVAWADGDRTPMIQEASRRRAEIFEAALTEMLGEHGHTADAIRAAGLAPRHVVDIGCGQALPDLLMHREFGCAFTLVDIEETEGQYHGWSDTGSGYSSLSAARDLLVSNGVPAGDVRTVNPRREPLDVDPSADLVTSYYSCGFHYPVDEYLPLFEGVLGAGGAVCLDLRRGYDREGGRKSATALLAMGEPRTVFADTRSDRLLILPR